MTRLLRLFRLVKILRVVRGMRSVRPLRLLLISIWSSISTLLWSIIFLCTIQILGALLVTQLMQSSITDRAVDLALRETLYHYFGRFTYSFYTMFEMTMSVGSWAKLGRLLIFEINWMWSFFFVVYGWIVIFAVIRVIS